MCYKNYASYISFPSLVPSFDLVPLLSWEQNMCELVGYEKWYILSSAVDVTMKDGIRFVTSIASNPYTDSNTLSSLAHPFVEGCVATSPITCNFIECIAALLIKESLVLSGWKVTQVSNRICRWKGGSTLICRYFYRYFPLMAARRISNCSISVDLL